MSVKTIQLQHFTNLKCNQDIDTKKNDNESSLEATKHETIDKMMNIATTIVSWDIYYLCPSDHKHHFADCLYVLLLKVFNSF